MDVKSMGNRLIRGGLYLTVFFAMFTAVFPLLWMLTTSFKTLDESMQWPPSILPHPFTLEAYAAVIFAEGVPRYLLNSVIYSVVGAGAAILLASLAGFSFGKYEFKGRKVLFAFVLATMMIPGQITLIPVFLILKKLGWLNSFLGLIIPGIGNAFGIFLIRQFALGIPDELLDSARIDGAGELLIYRHIFLPLCAPALCTLAVLDFMGRWNDLFWPLIVTNGDNLKTVQIALTTIASTTWVTLWNELTASMILALIPILLLYIFFQKYFTQGIVLTGIKG